MLDFFLAHRALTAMAAAVVSALTPLSDGALPSAAAPGTAAVSVDAGTTTATTLRLGAGMAWTDGDKTADKRSGALHPAMVRAVASLGVQVLRFPSGSFSNCYDWRRGVGPVAARRPNLDNWSPSGVVPCYADTSGDGFGTDEFMSEVAQISRLEGRAVEPIITVNICSVTAGGLCPYRWYPQICPNPLSGDLATGCPGALLAAHWVEYLNGSASTPFGAARARFGHAAPYGVHWFEIGNETHIVETRAQPLYSNVLRAYATAMRAADPTIGIIAQGDCLCPDAPPTLERDQALLDTVGSLIDGVAPHIYPDAGDTFGAVDGYLGSLQDAIRGAGLGAHQVAVMPTEWAAVDNVDAGLDQLQLNGDLRAGINDATELLAFIRHGVGAAAFFTIDGNPYQMLHCSTSNLLDTENACASPQAPPYQSLPGHVLQMLGAALGRRTASVASSGVVHAAATLDSDAAYVDLVNPTAAPLTVTVSFAGALPGGIATLRGMSGSDLAEDVARDSSAYPAATTTVVPRALGSVGGGPRMVVTLPPDCVAVLTVPLVSGGAAGATTLTPGRVVRSWPSWPWWTLR